MIQDNLWTAYLAVVMFGLLCLGAVFLAIRGIVIVFKAYKGLRNEEYERGYDPNDIH